LLSATYVETGITDAARDLEPDQTIMFRVEYKYLGGFNYSADQLIGLAADDNGVR
jgi:hypothetical protein